ncbi:MAG TPA: aldo/keto reductase [Devosiaceae bacterium]
MQYAEFGKTGVRVSRAAIGGHEYLPSGSSRGFNEDMALAVTRGYVGEGYGGEKRVAVLRAAFDLGINFFDVTIDSEKEALGRNLRDNPPPYPIYIQTRPEGMCYGYDDGNVQMLDYAGLKAEVQRILELMGIERIDFFNIGILQRALDLNPDFLERVGENLRRLKSEGLIGFAVADSFSGEKTYLEMVRSGVFDGVNLDFNIGERSALAALLPEVRQAGMGIVFREAFMKAKLFRMGEEAGIADRALLAGIALKWVASNNPSTILAGVATADQLRSNIAYLDSGPMSEVEREVLSRIEATAAFSEYRAEWTARFHPEPTNRETAS